MRADRDDLWIGLPDRLLHFRHGVRSGWLFRSDDRGESFVAIEDARECLGELTALVAGPLEHGTVYIGTPGRGVLVGRPKA